MYQLKVKTVNIMHSVQLSMQRGLRNVKIFAESITAFGILKKKNCFVIVLCRALLYTGVCIIQAS